MASPPLSSAAILKTLCLKKRKLGYYSTNFSIDHPHLIIALSMSATSESDAQSPYFSLEVLFYIQ
jgi:hypothetical protein